MVVDSSGLRNETCTHELAYDGRCVAPFSNPFSPALANYTGPNISASAFWDGRVTHTVEIVHAGLRLSGA